MSSHVEQDPTLARAARARRNGRTHGGGRGGRGGGRGGTSVAEQVGFRARRIATIASIIVLVPAFFSYAITIATGGNSSISIRSIEWLRTNGGAGFVSSIENFYYSLTAPSKGGAKLKALPHVGVAVHASQAAHHSYRPPNIAPLTSPALPEEGVWHSTSRRAGAYPPVLVTTFRSAPSEYPRLVAGVAWIDPLRTKIVLYPGTEQPSVQIPNRGPSEVPPALRGKLLATFNAGFKYEDSLGGFALNGHTYAPLRRGQGTVLGYTNGTANVVEWQGGPDVPSNVAFATQNLPLLVNEGRPSPRLNNTSEWGATLGNAVQVWRSGIGVNSRGDLIYAQADYQTAASLAQILIHAGAVRAMELDINSYWVSFNTYAGPGARGPTKLLPGTEREGSRYLTPDERDFFAVYER
ncbi:MAG: phosphodiester glycosidase family protein [Solirubrobacteraceae bacterium]